TLHREIVERYAHSARRRAYPAGERLDAVRSLANRRKQIKRHRGADSSRLLISEDEIEKQIGRDIAHACIPRCLCVELKSFSKQRRRERREREESPKIFFVTFAPLR